MLVAALDRTLGYATSIARQVIFVQQVPEMAFNPHGCIDDHPLRQILRIPIVCSEPRNTVTMRQSGFRGRSDEVLARHPSVAVIDPANSFCDASFCTAIKDGHLLYEDNNHLSRYGAALILKGLDRASAAVADR
jgi:hypothetical protein